MPAPTDYSQPILPEHQLQRIVSLKQAADLAGCSPDTLKRNYPEKIVRISPRRRGMRLRDALQLGGTAA